MRRLALLAALAAAPAGADDRPYRTEGGDAKKPWYELKPGVFPPADAAHADTGRLVKADGYNRAGRYISDGVHGIDYLDHYTDFELLPYATVRRHAAAADLPDFPAGDHLHVRAVPTGKEQGMYSGGKFTTAKLTELLDDFSHHAGRGELLRVEKADPGRGRVYVTVRKGGTPVGDPAKWTELSVGPDTRVWRGRGFAAPADVAAGQDILANTTGAFPFQDSGLKAHCTDIWLDAESRQAATDFQGARQAARVRRHGLPGWVDQTRGKRVTITLFDEAAGFAGAGPPEKWDKLQPGRAVTLRVATDGLRLWHNDGGMEASIRETRAAPRAGGVVLEVEPKFLLEGFRPGKVVRVFPAGWPAHGHPVEELYHPLMSP